MFLFAKPKLLPRYSNIPYTPLADHPNPRQRFLKHIFKILSALLVAATVITTICLVHNPKLGHLQQPSAPMPVISKDSRVVGLVFYGRRSRVEILDCYLKQNLKEHGGLLDEVIFLARTDDVDDLAFLDELVDKTNGYTKRDLTDKNSRASKVTYGQAWEVVERGTMYIKIDDDIMFIEKDAIASLVRTKVAHPEHLLICSNTINSPRLAWLHSHLSAIHPYLPEVSPPPPASNLPSTSHSSSKKLDWRPSLLPPWDGDPATFLLPRHPPPPTHSHPHRWLPLPAPYNTSLAGTPISLVEYGSSTEGERNWAVAAQEHMSFLANLERGELWRYGSNGVGGGISRGEGRGGGAGGTRERLWDMQGTRIQVNLIAIWGDDVVDNGPVPADDEHFLTVELVGRLGRRAVVDLNAVAVHYAFRHQRKGMETTDLLARYKALAEDRVCQ